MPVTVGNISIFMGPDALGAPDDLERVVVSFIGKAERKLDVAVQELESRPIAEALLAARARGIKVRLMLEGDYLSVKRRKENPFQPGGGNEENRKIFAAVLRGNIDVRTDYNPNIIHQKFIVRDIKKGKTALLTGSTNFTPTGTRNNLNHLVVVDGKSLANEYAREFEEIWGGTFGTARLRHDPKPRRQRISGVRVKALFAPDHSPEMEIMKQMLKAKRRIDFAIFTFSQSSGIDDTMIALQRAGVKIRGILDKGQSRDWAATGPPKAAGVELYVAPKGGGFNKLHHKLMVIDGQLVIAGSFNYTGPANQLNDENILVLGDLFETRQSSISRQKKLGKYALDEIDRIIQRFGKAA